MDLTVKRISSMIIFAVLYVILLQVLAPIGYGPVQFRVAQALVGLIPIFGWPAVFGIQLGQFLGNFLSPAGVLDVVLVWINLPFLALVKKWGLKALPILAFSVATRVAATLYYALNIPFLPTFVSVAISQTLSTVILATVVHYAMRKRINARF